MNVLFTFGILHTSTNVEQATFDRHTNFPLKFYICFISLNVSFYYFYYLIVLCDNSYVYFINKIMKIALTLLGKSQKTCQTSDLEK